MPAIGQHCHESCALQGRHKPHLRRGYLLRDMRRLFLRNRDVTVASGADFTVEDVTRK